MTCEREATALGVTFGDEAALDSLRKRRCIADADAGARRDALEALLAAKDAELAADAASAAWTSRRCATRRSPGWPSTTIRKRRRKLLAVYASLVAGGEAGRAGHARVPRAVRHRAAESDRRRSRSRRPICRPTWCGSCTISRTIRSTSCWPRFGAQVRSTAADKAELIAKYRELLAERRPTSPICSSAGPCSPRRASSATRSTASARTIGPDLTGSNRADVEYLLSNIVDPERRDRQGVSVDGDRHASTAASSPASLRRRTTSRSRSARRPKRSCCPRTKSTSAS